MIENNGEVENDPDNISKHLINHIKNLQGEIPPESKHRSGLHLPRIKRNELNYILEKMSIDKGTSFAK